MPSRILIAAAVIAGLALCAPVEAMAQGQPLIIPGQCSGGGYTPVCAVKKRTLVTYVNDCTAIAAGARVVSYHACHEGCPRRYAPVCAVDSTGRRATFGSACEAERSGAKIVRNRGCQGVLGRR
jgi:hypothetical protein